MKVETLLVDGLLFALGAGALLWAYLPFSPMTRDLVVFLSRDAQINLFKHRKLYWTVGIACLTVLLLRAFFSLVEPDGAGLLGAGASLLGRSHWLWLVPGGTWIGWAQLILP